MSWLLAFAGFAALIILHELGHFAVAKAVGMRVERFSLFFGPLLFKLRRGETEYGIGPIPLGGYVRITGMNPREELPPEIARRGYFAQPVWKRIAVITAGPAMNLVVAFLIFAGIFLANGHVAGPSRTVAAVDAHQPASGLLLPGDTIVSVDGRTGSLTTLSSQIASHHCAGPAVNGCPASSPARIVLRRSGHLLTVMIVPRYDATLRRTRVGFSFGNVIEPVGPLRAASLSLDQIWRITSVTVSTVARLVYSSQARHQIHGTVGLYETTRQAFRFDATTAFFVLGLISLSLAIINLFPFLPLDGGHVFWAVAEKVRGRAIPFSVMERAGAVGFALIMFVFLIGLTNDVTTLRNGGFHVR